MEELNRATRNKHASGRGGEAVIPFPSPEEGRGSRIRNALAHGNVVYLDERDFETKGAQVQYLGFLSRYEKTVEERTAAETYRLVVATEEGILHFVKAWATWLAAFEQLRSSCSRPSEPRPVGAAKSDRDRDDRSSHMATDGPLEERGGRA